MSAPLQSYVDRRHSPQLFQTTLLTTSIAGVLAVLNVVETEHSAVRPIALPQSPIISIIDGSDFLLKTLVD